MATEEQLLSVDLSNGIDKTVVVFGIIEKNKTINITRIEYYDN